MLSFSAEIFIIGVNPYVFLPENILQELFVHSGKNKGAIPVKGKINGKDFVQTLVRYQGFWRLYINGIMRKAAGVNVGDTVDIEIIFDPVLREIPMHPQFQKALGKNEKAKKMFESFSPSRRKEINRYLHSIKTEEILKKNIERIVRYLAGEKVEYFVLLRNK
jgi:uncharacterized protein YdeI (YjbR/CyaY-like superfamily)